MLNLDDLGLCVEYIGSAETIEVAFSRYSEVLQQDGYDKVVYTLINDHHSLELPATHGLVSSYPEGWMRHYNENNYLDKDAVVIKALSCRTPFFWDDLFHDPNFSQESLRIVQEGCEAGVKDGIAMSFTGMADELSGVAIARDESDDKNKDYTFLSKVYFLSVFFNETFRKLHMQKFNPPKLTLREKDVVLWACEGRSDQQISDILKISTDTVRFHWKNIFKKLGSKNKTHAVVKSIRLGLIVPNLLRSR